MFSLQVDVVGPLLLNASLLLVLTTDYKKKRLKSCHFQQISSNSCTETFTVCVCVWVTVQHAQNWVSSDLPVGTPVTPHHSTPEIGDAPQVSAGMTYVSFLSGKMYGADDRHDMQ